MNAEITITKMNMIPVRKSSPSGDWHSALSQRGREYYKYILSHKIGKNEVDSYATTQLM